MANDLLTTVCLASKAQLALAPAMNQAMWSHSITQENCTTLRRHGAHLFGPGIGEQACGDIGAGRMLEPLDLVDQTLRLCKQNDELAGLHVVITAGPTREAIDPVRYISNHSSGKMGYALAAAAAAAGAQVTLISGPVNITPPNGVTCLNVISAREMHEASMLHSKQADIFIASAAVADYRPLSTSEQKMKKQGDSGLSLTLTQNPDIVASVAQQQNKPFTVGFAAETENVVEYAQDKLRRKNLDMIIANNVADSRIGFNSDENAVTVISADKQVSLAQTSKTNLAQQLISLISAQRKNETAR
jgi:phosphopantothenoylcysteine decarboxylase/phosphopantothenate--cysteine ligase